MLDHNQYDSSKNISMVTLYEDVYAIIENNFQVHFVSLWSTYQILLTFVLGTSKI